MALKGEEGFSLIDVLVAVCLLAIMGISLAYSNVNTIQTVSRTERNAIALRLATEKLEQMSAIDPINISDINDSTESITWLGSPYTRVTDVTVNADGSRTILVTVTGGNTILGGSAEVEGTFQIWGSI